VVTLPIALAVAVLLGIALAAGVPTLLRRLPEPAVEDTETGDPSDAKIAYAALATPRFAAVVGVLATVAVVIAATQLPIAALPAWLVLGTLGSLLAAIDARTTWLPLPLTRAAWVAMAGALAVGGAVGGWLPAVRGAGGFAIAGAVFGAAWLLSRRGFGFGDVRFAPLVGAATATVSWSLLAWALVLGSLAGAMVGLVRLALGRRGAFAYAPSILAGGYLAVAVAWLTT
jgi:leader peptidase (prepilin peptidase)/N-methyltransferase